MKKPYKLLAYGIEGISQKLRRIRIPTRLSVSYVFVSMVPVIAIGAFSNYIAQKSVLEKMNDYSLQIAECINYDTERYLEELLDLSDSIIYSDDIQKLLQEYVKNPQDKSASKKIVSYIQNNVPPSTLSDIRIVMENGDLIHYKWVYRLLAAEMERLKEVVLENEGLPVFVPVQLESSNTGVSLVRAIYNPDSLEKIGEIYITVTEKSIRDIYSNIDLGSGSAIYIINSQGEIISTDKEDVTFNASKLLEGLKSAKTDHRENFDFEIEDEEYFTTYNEVDNRDWYIICMVPYSYLNDTVNQLSIYIYVCAAICLLACTIFTVLINRSISKPLTNLRNHMKNAGNENLPDKITDNSRDEIADVAESFNSMIDEINDLIRDVHASEQQKSAEKLKALQAQINPHFLSNTLNTVKWMASLQKADNIENLITSLIQLLQVSMGKVEDLVPMSREIEYIRNYVEIQSYKYCDKFTVEYNIDEEAANCLLPPFSIQPIVENAIIHGIEPKAGSGMIWINACCIGEEVVCTVKDNGVGFQDEKSWDEAAGKLSPRHISGIGMKNADERIKMFFGEEYGITYESLPGIYTKVKIRFPYTVGNSDAEENKV